jgi:hypothetical protein
MDFPPAPPTITFDETHLLAKMQETSLPVRWSVFGVLAIVVLAIAGGIILVRRH